MKLNKKLISLSSAALAIGTITPLTVVSCGNATTYSITDENYKPTTFDAYDMPAAYTQYEATKQYVEFVKKNKNNFVQDLKYGTWLNWTNIVPFRGATSVSPYVGEIEKLEISVSDLSFGTTKVSFPGYKAISYPTVSMKMKTKVSFYIQNNHQLEIDESQQIVGTGFLQLHYDIETTTTYKNVIFTAAPWGDKNPESLVRNNYTFNNSIFNITMFDNKKNIVNMFRADNWDFAADCHIVKVATDNDGSTKTELKFNDSFRNFDLFNEMNDVIVQGSASFDDVNDVEWMSQDQIEMYTTHFFNRFSDPIMALDFLYLATKSAALSFQSYYLSKCYNSYEIQLDGDMFGQPDPEGTGYKFSGWWKLVSSITEAKTGNLITIVTGIELLDDFTCYCVSDPDDDTILTIKGNNYVYELEDEMTELQGYHDLVFKGEFSKTLESGKQYRFSSSVASLKFRVHTQKCNIKDPNNPELVEGTEDYKDVTCQIQSGMFYVSGN